MKFFVDTADIAEIRTLVETGLLVGVNMPEGCCSLDKEEKEVQVGPRQRCHLVVGHSPIQTSFASWSSSVSFCRSFWCCN